MNAPLLSATAPRPGKNEPLPTAAASFNLDGQAVDVLDLKTLLITRGINLPEQITAQFGPTRRLAPASDPFACNCLLLPGGIPAHMFHVGPGADFSLAADSAGAPWLTYRGRPVTQVDFPPATAFYDQQSRAGFPFRMMAVLQGLDVVSFPYLWPCQFALAGQPCDFCYQGNMTLAMRQAGLPLPPIASPDDVADAVEYCLRECGTRDVQLTGGSEVDSARGEVPLAADILAAIDRKAGLRNIPGEIYVYTSAPKDPAAVDALFAAGVDRVAYDLNVWDEAVFEQVCPGIFRHIGRPQQLRALPMRPAGMAPTKYAAHSSSASSPSRACWPGPNMSPGSAWCLSSPFGCLIIAPCAAPPPRPAWTTIAAPARASPVCLSNINWSRRALPASTSACAAIYPSAAHPPASAGLYCQTARFSGNQSP
jgi:hypothetical protein